MTILEELLDGILVLLLIWWAITTFVVLFDGKRRK